MTLKDFPNNYTCHIRDPKVWKEEDGYYMILGGRRKNDQGAVLIYHSEDKKQWELKEEVTTEQPFGFMWECPDLYEIEDKKILSISPQGLIREEYKNQNVYQSGYYLMNRDEWKTEEFTEWDMGFDFYAPQTFAAPDGRRIMIGWAGMPDSDKEYTNATTEFGWQHVLTVPRVLTVKGDKVYQNPVAELETLRDARYELQSGVEISMSTPCFELKIKDLKSSDCEIYIEKDCCLSYREGVFSVEFLNDKLGSGRAVRRAKVEHLENVRVLADTSILEIYLNDGETVFTTRYYPEGEERDILWKSERGCGEIWNLSA